GEPERARQALTAISATGRQALAEMRRLLGVLRSDDQAADLAPQPGLDQLRDLLEQTRAAGRTVTFTLGGEPRPLTGGGGPGGRGAGRAAGGGGPRAGRGP